MDFRTGKCSQCGAEYKVPASFAHNVARCKKCQGVVHLGPAPAPPAGSAPRPKEPAPPAAIPAKRVVPKAEATRPPSPEARKPESGIPPRPAGTPKPVPTSPVPLRSGAPERPKGERTPLAARAGPTAEPAKKREGSAGHERRGRPEKKKPPVAGILSGAALVVVGAGLYLFRGALFGGADAGSTQVAGSLAAAGTDAAGSATPPLATPAPPAREPLVEDSAAPAAPKPKAEPKPKDPNSIDLSAVADFQPTSDTTPEEWAQMSEWVAQWMDIDAGAAGNRAKLELVKRSRKAVPAILNAFKALDFATREGRSNGDQCQKALMQICNGTNFDWKYADEAAGRPYDHPDDVWFCKRVVELWANSWKQAEQDIRAWIKIAKLEEKDPAEAQRLLEMFGSQKSAPESAGGGDDDLEVD
jgi:hypothetical protein